MNQKEYSKFIRKDRKLMKRQVANLCKGADRAKKKRKFGEVECQILRT